MTHLEQQLQQHRISLPSECYQKFQIFGEELLKWNKIHNLSGVSSMESVEDNVLDSLYPLKFIDDFQNCMDVGSGGGFPAMVLAIAKPTTRFFLVEPRIKRSSFLKNITLELGLDNVFVLTHRIQEVPITEVNNLDLITSRAVMDAKELIYLTRKFLKNEGYFLLYKGLNFRKEMPHMSIEECFERDRRIYYYKKGKDLAH